MRKRTHYIEDYTRKDGEHIELELEFEAYGGEVTVVEKDDKIIVGYLVLDEICTNPLEACDGIGAIHHHPKSWYGRRESDYYDILGLDSYGDPIVDEDKLQELWEKTVHAIPLKLFHVADRKVREAIRLYGRYGMALGYRETLRDALAREDVGDYALAEQAHYAWSSLGVPCEVREAIIERIEDAIDFNYEKAVEMCVKPGNPDAALLDLYDHGGCVWSISERGMNCRWDTSRGEAVWAPDKHLQEELAKIEDPDARYAQAVIYAEQAVELYNAWSSGDCYGVVVQTHDKEGAMEDEDAVWGYVGGEHAEEELALCMKYRMKEIAA